MDINELSHKVIGAAIEVHKELGPGLLESTYEECLCHELTLQNIPFTRQQPLPIKYKGVNLDCGYRLDLVVDDRLILELKSVKELDDVHRAQLMTYLKLFGSELGLLLNFNVPILTNGVKRIALGAPNLK